MAEALAREFALRITDLDDANIGIKRFGVIIQSPQEAQQNIEWCDLMVVTGSTAVNNTMQEFIGKKVGNFLWSNGGGASIPVRVESFLPLGRLIYLHPAIKVSC
jgi:Domain of unknown function (DUF364).